MSRLYVARDTDDAGGFVSLYMGAIGPFLSSQGRWLPMTGTRLLVQDADPVLGDLAVAPGACIPVRLVLKEA